MKMKIDFQLNRSFGVVERIVFRLALNGFSNTREMEHALPIFSDAVIANAVKHLVNEQIISVDVETGTLSLSEAVVAIIAMCKEKTFEIAISDPVGSDMLQEGAEIIDNSIPEAIDVKKAIMHELLPCVKMDTLLYSLDFIIFPMGKDVGNE